MSDTSYPPPDKLPGEAIQTDPGRLSGLAVAVRRLLPPFDQRGYTESLIYTVAALAAGFVLKRTFGITNVGLVFLLAILASAVRHGLWPALLSCVVAVLAFNFFFLPPVHTFSIADPENMVVLAIFGIVALIASNLTARVRSQALVARERATVTESLYQFSRKLAGVFALDDLLWVTSFHIAQMLKVRVVILLPDEARLTVRAGYPPDDRLDLSEVAAADWVWLHATPAGRGTDTLPGAHRLYLPMRTGRGTIGVIGLDSDGPGPLLTPDQRRLFDALADQAALAIERVHLADDVERSRLTAETEKLRAALLTSISHDLRTPLSVILGAASCLKDLGAALDPAAHRELAATIQEEGERLNRFIANLLDMTRLESGAVAPHLDPTDVGDVAGSALRRAGRVLAGHKLGVAIEPDLPLVKLDPVLFEQVLFNLLDNAGKYAAAGTTISLTARRDGASLKLEIADEGPGIPIADLSRIFDKFYRVLAADRQRAGTGLGLAIARGFVEAMGGTLTAANRSDGKTGAIFTITFPVEAA
jgi:two-component system sensor histidine kinase KdpD